MQHLFNILEAHCCVNMSEKVFLSNSRTIDVIQLIQTFRPVGLCQLSCSADEDPRVEMSWFIVWHLRCVIFVNISLPHLSDLMLFSSANRWMLFPCSPQVWVVGKMGHQSEFLHKRLPRKCNCWRGKGTVSRQSGTCTRWSGLLQRICWRQ